MYSIQECRESVADPGGVQGVRTPAVLIRVLFLEKKYMFSKYIGGSA